ncbi:Prohead core protein serine protease [Balnearium lithotrophicum]|uniref:Prohead core protein serine protease n=1 Tax=Balnearium lithotrophicum TaxID=223788 RepID=A0A521CJB2_9BACT|nr:hypothetical protein [Balnearium lithotrophicum]SMO59536.1 Prohead core protein serine protease [Balnearium lithotrophicum]
MSKQLIIDFVSEITPQLVESKDGKYKFKGIFQRADVKNGNGRIYPKKVLEKAVAKYQGLIREGRALGMIEHPADGKTRLDEAAIKITSLSMNDKGEVIGEAEVLVGTPKGDILKNLIDNGVKFGISSRGSGTLIKRADGTVVVGEDYEFLAFDVVYDPSTPGAFPEPIKESKEDKPMELTLETLKRDYPDLVEAIKKEAKEELRQEFEERVIEAIEQKSSKMREEIKEELLSDPDIAGAKVAVEGIIDILKPFISEGIAGEHVEELKDRIKQLEESLRKKDDEIKTLKEDVERKEIALYIEQKLSESPYGNKIKEAGILKEAKSKEQVDKLIQEFEESIRKTIDESNQGEPKGKSSVNEEKTVSVTTIYEKLGLPVRR